MSKGELYTLKYEIKRALAEPENKKQNSAENVHYRSSNASLTKADKERLKEVQKQVTQMGQAFWLYGLLDVAYSTTSLIRNFRANNFVLHKMAIKTVLVCSVRLFIMYEISN